MASSDKKVSAGESYSLQEAYDNGWLTQSDLMSIAYYYHGGRAHNEEIMPEDYSPQAKTPEVLSEETELKIKETKAGLDSLEYSGNYTAEHILITQYLGTYHGNIVVEIKNYLFGGPGWVKVDTFNGVAFLNGGGYEIMVFIN